MTAEATPRREARTTRVTIVPHTHWDREWYEPFDAFRDRLVVMMDTLIEVGGLGFPHFHLDGQTAMIDDYLVVRPEREAEIRRLAVEGRLSLGPWTTQMDEFLTSGESHIRNLERGLARARALGPPLETGYLPDQFGHIGQMPQLLRMAGIDTAVVWRGVPATIERDAFWWEAPDGSRVLADYLPFGYFNGEAFERLEEPEELAGAVERTVERQRRFAAADRMLVMVGYDHAGPDATLPERLHRAGPHLRGIEATIGSIATHIRDRALLEELPAWRGELRSSARAHLLPNVVSARVHQKRERARVEALLERYAEPLVALVPGATGGARELERAWTLLLWNGAHDSVCGCSHDQVGRDVDMRHAEARGLAEGLVQDALTTLGSATADRGTLWFNPSPFERDGIPGLGWVVEPGRGPAEGSPWETIPVPLEAAGRGIVADGVELALVDEPDVGDLYNFCPAEAQHPSPPDSVEVEGDRARLTWRGLEVSMRVGQGRGDGVLRVEGDIENRRPDHRLRVHVRLPSDVDHVIAGSPFELVTRGLTSEGGELEQASPTWPARGVVLAGELAVLQEGVFEYEIVDGRWLAITVLRCVGTISRPVLATRPFRAGPDVPTPDAQMIGSTPFAFGVWRGGAGGRSISSASRSAPVLGNLLEAWERFALPLVGGVASGEGTLPSPGSLLDVRGDAELSSIRRRGPDAEVRLWNPYRDRDVAATVAGRPIRLRPAEIASVTLPRPPALGA